MSKKSNGRSEAASTEVTRRDVVKGGLGLAALGATGGLAAAGSLAGCGSSTSTGPAGPGFPVAVFPQPPELVSSGGFLTYPLDIMYATNSLATGTPKGVVNFLSRTFNGLLTGATLRIQAGDNLKIPIHNMLPANAPPLNPGEPNSPHNFNSTNMHTHGFHVPPGEDDVFIHIVPDQQYQYEYNLPTDHPAGTMWYHPHKHGSTAMQLFSGMSGIIIIEGDASNGDLNSVPEIGNASEVIFNVNELNLQGLGLAPALDPYEVQDYVLAPGPNTPFPKTDSVWVVNGEFQPNMEVVPGQVVRLRVLNASARERINLSVESHDMHLCALDGITIPNMRTLLPAQPLVVHSANRADVLVKFDTPGTYNIYRNNPATPAGIIATVTVAGTPFDMPLPAPNAPLPVPTSLGIPPAIVPEMRELWYEVDPVAAIDFPGPMIGNPPMVAKNFVMGPAQNQGRRLDPNRIDQNISLKSVIEWTLQNTSGAAHPHHIHIHPFQVMATSDGMLNGIPLVPGTWADTIAVPTGTPAIPGTATLLQYYPDNPGFYVIHCHILAHEDIGMMQNVHLA
jgi:FtsP/CotA-like multicopper oxidase with cupredoxin domain